ncbi:sensor histidine kinase [Algihabitans albus]|uniref:sensor histidine kinase n=1 Tax=Algihabitans albus TaxID=2164067 RepID=UPI000E5D4E8C|nr:HAMP domain-containing sensor histidine kinase [Algihabitans albus]
MAPARWSLAQILTRRLILIASAVVVLNVGLVGLYYGSDTRELETQVVADAMERLGAAIEDVNLPADAPVRDIYRNHPTAYGFALVDRTGTVGNTMNRALIPPAAVAIYADDWITRMNTPQGRLLVGGHEFAGRSDGLRAVFVMADDPANLMRRAFFAELRRHVWLPILPMALVLITASALLIRRGLAPVAEAAAWARGVEPGATVPDPPPMRASGETADLIEAVERALDRLTASLTAEKRRAAEAAHALRTPVAVLVARLDALPPGEATEKLRADLTALSRTVQQVLAAARSDTLDVAEAEPLDLRDVARAVTTVSAPLAYSNGIELILTVPDTPVMVRANAEGVELALTNLVENAVLHAVVSPVTISVGLGPIIRVRDHGPGLPSGEPHRVFEPFWRGPDAPSGGAGLGLAIVERLQKAQGGTVDAISPEGGGCEITLTYLAAS